MFTPSPANWKSLRTATIHPDTRHVKDKIRQRLRVLPPSLGFGVTSRDAGLLLHIERGVWRLP